MALTQSDLDDVVALWQEWAGPQFRLVVEVVEDAQPASVTLAGLTLSAQLRSSCSVEVRIFKELGARFGEILVFKERLPYDGRLLRGTVGELARAIAQHEEA